MTPGWDDPRTHVTMTGYAGPVRPVRPVRGLSTCPGWAGASRRVGKAAGPVGYRRSRGADRGVSDGAPGVVDSGTTARRSRIRAHPEGGAAVGRGCRPDLPNRPTRLGRTI